MRESPLQRRATQRRVNFGRTSLAREMLKYDSVGMTSWVGEDFDQRVLSVLSEHRQAVLAGATTTPPLYTVIVEEGEKVPEMAQTLEDRLGRAALAWMQVLPY